MTVHNLPSLKAGFAALAEANATSIKSLHGQIDRLVADEHQRKAAIVRAAENYFHHGIDVEHGWMEGAYDHLRRMTWRDELASLMGWRYVKMWTTYNGTCTYIQAPRPVFNRGVFATFTLVGERTDNIIVEWATTGPDGVVQWELTNNRVLFLFRGAAQRLAQQFYEGCYHNAEWIAAITKRGKPRHNYMNPMPWVVA